MENEKKVYVFLSESVDDGEFETSVEVFDNAESARGRMKLSVDEFRANDRLVEMDGFVEEISEERHDDCICSYIAYVEGEYSENHVSFSVLEKTVYHNAKDGLGV